MLFGQNRNQIRQVFIEAWRKYNAKEALEPLEQVIAHIIAKHPEYHNQLTDTKTTLDKDYVPEMGQSNPFLHMGLHISIQEQISVNQPSGINTIYESLLSKHQDSHEVEHMMMECLAQTIWEVQRNNGVMNEDKYIECLKKL